MHKELAIQKSRVTALEDFITENLPPLICPVEHQFADGVCCRIFFMPKDTVLTGVEYKKEIFWLLARGSLRISEGDHTRDLTAPHLMKNQVGTKNAWYSYDDCIIYGFIPTNSTNVLDILNSISVEPAEEIQGMGANKQQIKWALK